jgi:outer membrane protein TolC
MRRLNIQRHAKKSVLALAMLSLAGCASVDVTRSIEQTNVTAAAFTQGRLQLALKESERSALLALANALLEKPLQQNEAVQVALANSPAMQTLIAHYWANAAATAQSGRIANPIFMFERTRSVDELEIARLFAFGLLDLLTLPRRYSVAQQRLAQSQIKFTAEVIEHVTEIRQAWVRAVAAAQMLVYAEQVNGIAQASAELARRMQSVGNFNKLQRARQQAFYADAATQLANANHLATASRENFVRLLGLTDEQAEKLKIPDRLPELPIAPIDGATVGASAVKDRLDVAMSKRSLDALAKEQGLEFIYSFTDIELAARKDSNFEVGHGARSSVKGFEVTLRLPIFDWGGMKREAMNAQLLASVNQLESTLRSVASNLRTSYSSYRTSYDVAKHFRDEVVPLRKVIAEENLLRYNGMIIGVFELLADARDQVGSVIAAINAQQQFWLSEAALQASMAGKPTLMPAMAIPPGTSIAGGGAAH